MPLIVLGPVSEGLQRVDRLLQLRIRPKLILATRALDPGASTAEEIPMRGNTRRTKCMLASQLFGSTARSARRLPWIDDRNAGSTLYR